MREVLIQGLSKDSPNNVGVLDGGSGSGSGNFGCHGRVRTHVVKYALRLDVRKGQRRRLRKVITESVGLMRLVEVV